MWRTCVTVIGSYINAGREVSILCYLAIVSVDWTPPGGACVVWFNSFGTEARIFVLSNDSFGQSPVRWTGLFREEPVWCDYTPPGERGPYFKLSDNSLGQSPVR